jgi:radical SAM protein with 4Fe4S-binding SPASM domain
VKHESYGAFSEAFHNAGGLARAPLNGTIEVTHRCPLTCAHCYNNLPMADRGAAASELTTAEHIRILDELADAGCLWLLFSGGEIFARRDFLDIYTHARRIGFLITLFTNGTMITPRVADHLAKYRPFAIEITLYGHTRETYERLTGIPGSYGRCLRGIELLMERGLPLALKTVAVTINKHEVFDMQRFAEERGLEFKFDSMMNPRIDCSHSPLAVRLSPAECVAFDLADPRRMDEWKLFAEKFLGPANPPERSDELYHCGGGVSSFSIDPYGGMSICVLSRVDRFDLRRGSVLEGWHAFLRGVREKKMTRPTKCTRCELKSMCGMCPANGELENRDAEAPVDFLCQVAHLRAHAFGFPIAPHGDCEYCPGGSGHEKLLADVTALGETHGPQRALGEGLRLLPLMQMAPAGGCSTGGCHGCGCGQT